MLRVLLTGSRTWTKPGPIKLLILGLKACYPDVHFILGDAPNGLDAIAKKVCEEEHVSHRIHIADWDILGKRAGHVRNGEMVKDHPDLAYAFRSNGESRGTDNCVKQCLAAKIPTYTVQQNEPFPDPLAKGYRYNSAQDPTDFEGYGALDE